jgi:hypothetical protein
VCIMTRPSDVLRIILGNPLLAGGALKPRTLPRFPSALALRCMNTAACESQRLLQWKLRQFSAIGPCRNAPRQKDGHSRSFSLTKQQNFKTVQEAKSRYRSGVLLSLLLFGKLLLTCILVALFLESRCPFLPLGRRNDPLFPI